MRCRNKTISLTSGHDLSPIHFGTVNMFCICLHPTALPHNHFMEANYFYLELQSYLLLSNFIANQLCLKQTNKKKKIKKNEPQAFVIYFINEVRPLSSVHSYRMYIFMLHLYFKEDCDKGWQHQFFSEILLLARITKSLFPVCSHS